MATSDRVVADFERYFGNQTRLENWQRLCSDVKIAGAYSLRSIKACKEALSKVHVNIQNLVDSQNPDPTKRKELILHPTKSALSRWTKKNDMFYPLKKAKQGGPVRALLVKMNR